MPGTFLGLNRDNRLARLANILLAWLSDNAALTYHRTVYEAPSGQPRRAFVLAGFLPKANIQSMVQSLIYLLPGSPLCQVGWR